MKTIYIAGPMRGYKCFNFANFFYWQVVLEKAGYKVANPAEHDVDKMLSGWVYNEDQYSAVLLYDIQLIKERVDAVFSLKNADQSPGARAEIGFATAIGLDTYAEEYVELLLTEKTNEYPTMDAFQAREEVLRELFG